MGVGLTEWRLVIEIVSGSEPFERLLGCVVTRVVGLLEGGQERCWG
jgi:hypothetical protein